MSVIGIFIIILSFVGIIAGLGARNDRDEAAYSWLAWLGLVGIFIRLGFTTIATVPRGHVGVAIQFRGVTGDFREQGLQFKSPLVKLQQVNVQTQKYEVEATAASQDLQDVTTTIALNYHLNPSSAPAMYRDLGIDYIEKLAAPAVQETVKKITAKYLAEDLILKRAVVKDDITQDLRARLVERGIITEAVSITNFTFSEVFAQAIEAKVAAQQAVFEAQNKLERVKVEAQQREAQALGEANAAIKEAEGKARAITIVTEAQQNANELIDSSLSTEVLQYIFYDRLGKNIKVVVVPQGQSFVIPEMTE
jgi:regulator of protease activity HflC (stomatin/prohibitin superfamily)